MEIFERMQKSREKIQQPLKKWSLFPDTFCGRLVFPIRYISQLVREFFIAFSLEILHTKKIDKLVYFFPWHFNLLCHFNLPGLFNFLFFFTLL